ncbi:MAG: CehA/McbA family metallohydrolase [bacterium]
MKNAKRFFLFAVICFVSIFIMPSRAHAYTELHIQKNMYPRKEPDIVADTVTRLAKSAPIPVLLILRHTDIFPTELENVEITADFGGGVPSITKTAPYNLRLKQLTWSDLQYVEPPAGYVGAATINVKFNMKIRGAKVTALNNNLRNLKRAPLKVYVGAGELPRFEGWRFGDIHFHTAFTDNQVEFGAPIDVSAMMAARYGLDWTVFTDHSFDLDDVEGDTLKNDPGLGKWKRTLESVNAARKKHPGVVFMPGEELTCGNGESKNVHMVVLNNKKFYPGNGDGYEGNSVPDLSCASVTAGLPKTEAAFAAHPISEISAVEIYMINRGNWSLNDMAAPGLTGLESWNHDLHPKKEGFDAWVQLLLAGKRKYLSAGTDSHGDFSAEFANAGYEESARLPFGAIRTAVYVPGRALTAEKVIEALRAGRVVATSGPFATIELKNSVGKTAGIGGEISAGKGGKPIVAVIDAKSSPEFGPLVEIKVITGEIGAAAESVISDYKAPEISDPMNFRKSLDLPAKIKNGYIRVEAYSQIDGVIYEAYTNPVWFKK